MAGNSKMKKRKRGETSTEVDEKKKLKIETHLGASNKDTVEKSNGSKDTLKQLIKKTLGQDLPDDFYEFWEFCKELNPESPSDGLVNTLGLKLAGPYDIISGDLKEIVAEHSCALYNLHSRFICDPPEFSTVIKEVTYKTGFHIGYFCDVPNELPVFMASNECEKNYDFKICGDNIFAAVLLHANELMKKMKDKSKMKEVKKLSDEITSRAKLHQYKLDMITSQIKARNKKIVTKSFHKLGIVVPLDNNDVGYRPLNLSDAALKKLLTRISKADGGERDRIFDELHDLITLVQFANDECDYGMGLELGIDLLCFGNSIFNNSILQLLPLAYSLLGRNLFGDIVEKHIRYRKMASLCKFVFVDGLSTLFGLAFTSLYNIILVSFADILANKQDKTLLLILSELMIGMEELRHSRFIETNPDAIKIEDATTVQKQSHSHSIGFGHVLYISEEEAIEMLRKDMKSNDLLKEAWNKATEVLQKCELKPKDKLTLLSDDCKAAVIAYTLENPNLYRYFNTDSRGVNNFFVWESFQYKGLWLLLHKALFSPSASYDTPFLVYRGCTVQFSVNIGSRIMFQQFVSTTTNKKIAEEFAASVSGTMFIIEVSVALGIQKLSVFPKEEEFLLAPNHGFTVVDVKQKNGVREIYLKTMDFSFVV